jgi:DNA-binding CsgD family transcriptional regulator
MLAGLRFRPEDLVDPESRIDWDEFSILLDRTLDACGGDEPFGALMAETARLSIPPERVWGVFPDLQSFYLWLVLFAARELHTNLQTTIRTGSDGALVLEHHIPRPYRPSRALAVASAATFRGAPRLLGLPDAVVACAFDERCGLYRVVPPAGGSAALRQPGTGAEAEAAGTRVLRCGLGLVEAASRHDFLARLEEGLRLLGGCTAGRIWSRRAEGPMVRLHAWGVLPADPADRMLVLGARIVGRAELAEAADADPERRAAVQELLTWAAVALERGTVAERAEARLGFTPRERQVFNLVAQGCSDKEIAQRLGTSPKTVSHQVGDLLRKGGVENRTALAGLSAHSFSSRAE